MRSRQWDDEEGLLGNLGAAVRGAGHVPDSISEAGRAAFAARAASPGIVVAAIGYDSLLDDELQLRGDAPTGPRILTFEADGLCVEIELADDQIVGQLVPPTAGDVVLMTTEGIAGQTAADSVGCFVLPRPAPGAVRFRCQVGGSAVITDWVRL